MVGYVLVAGFLAWRLRGTLGEGEVHRGMEQSHEGGEVLDFGTRGEVHRFFGLLTLLFGLLWTGGLGVMAVRISEAPPLVMVGFGLFIVFVGAAMVSSYTEIRVDRRAGIVTTSDVSFGRSRDKTRPLEEFDTVRLVKQRTGGGEGHVCFSLQLMARKGRGVELQGYVHLDTARARAREVADFLSLELADHSDDHAPAGRAPSGTGVTAGDGGAQDKGSADSTAGAAPVPSPTADTGPAEPGGELLVTLDGKRVDLRQPEVVLDTTTPLEKLTQALFFVALAVTLFGPPVFHLPLWVSGVGVVAMVLTGGLMVSVDCHWVLDNRRRRIDYSRRILAFHSRFPAASFDSIALVTVDGVRRKRRRKRWWEYRVVLLLDDGTVVTVTDSEEGLGGVNDLARSLAEHVGSRFEAGQPECGLRITPDPSDGSLRIEHVEGASGPFDLVTVLVGVGLLLFLVLRPLLAPWLAPLLGP